MCRVKTGNEIHTEQDVQNLVTAIILRQRGRYTKPYLVKATKKYLPAPEVRVVVDDNQVKGMIDNTLAVLHKVGKVRQRNGIYYPAGIKETVGAVSIAAK